jgi:hypothetical protein
VQKINAEGLLAWPNRRTTSLGDKPLVTGSQYGRCSLPEPFKWEA